MAETSTRQIIRRRSLNKLTIVYRYMMICVNDILIIVGSVLKELIELGETAGDLWNFCSVFLGTGSILVWIGMLRYLGFFDTYNVLILTLKGALPNVIRFTICAGMVYSGYLLCGFVVFGPYHFKFTTLDSTSECLFSLINGKKVFCLARTGIFSSV
jgi:mucolipin 3